jgi:uncharacterized membrane protein
MVNMLYIKDTKFALHPFGAAAGGNLIMVKSNTHTRVGYITRMGALLAIIIILTAFNIGNIPIGPVVATIYQVPVIVGAVILGPSAGSVLGGVWGVFSFILALTGNTTDVVALATIQQSPFIYFIISFVPRLLTGLLPGLLFKLLTRIEFFKNIRFITCGITGAVGSLVNTILYLGALYLLIRELLASLFNIEIGAVGAMVMGVAMTNGLVEAAVSFVLVAAICSALIHFLPMKK